MTSWQSNRATPHPLPPLCLDLFTSNYKIKTAEDLVLILDKTRGDFKMKKNSIVANDLWFRMHETHLGLQRFFLFRNSFYLNLIGCINIDSNFYSNSHPKMHCGFGFIIDINDPVIYSQYNTEVHYRPKVPNLLGAIKRDIDHNVFDRVPISSNWLPHSYLTAHPEIERRIMDTFNCFFKPSQEQTSDIFIPWRLQHLPDNIPAPTQPNLPHL